MGRVTSLWVVRGGLLEWRTGKLRPDDERRASGVRLWRELCSRQREE